MITTTREIESLNDLVRIMNDRIVGYENALKETKQEDHDLKTLFSGMIDESRKIKLALATELEVLGGDVEEGTTTMGKIYRAWVDVKSVFTGKDRHAVLSNCESEEDAVQRAYNSILQGEPLAAYIRAMLVSQQARLKKSHDEIKALRDREAR